MSFGGGLWLARHDPGLLRERLGSLIQRDQKRWDKILMAVMLVLWTGWLILMALDSKRFHWSAIPVALQVAGVVLICVGSYVVWLTFRANSYAAPVIKIQKERGHLVGSVLGCTPMCVTRCMPARSCSSPACPCCSDRGGVLPPAPAWCCSSPCVPCSRSAPSRPRLAGPCRLCRPRPLPPRSPSLVAGNPHFRPKLHRK